MYPREEAEFGPPTDASLECFAARLAALSPRARLDRDRLMYLAGQASVGASIRRPPRWMWPAACSAMTALAACLLVLLASRPEPKVVERIVRVRVPIKSEESAGDRQASADNLPDNPGVGRPSRPSFATDGLEGRPTQRPAPRDVPAASYLHLRDRALALEFDDWPAPRGSSDGGAGPPPDNYRDLLTRMLREG